MWSVFIFIAKRKVNSLALVIFLLFFLMAVPLISAADDYGLEATAQEGYGADTLKTINQDPAVLVGQLIGAGLAFIGIIFFILVIYGGFIWMTAGGNEEKVKKAISLIIQAVIGLIIVAAAYLITRFIGEALIGNLG